MAKIKTADERIAAAKVAQKGVEDAYIDLAVQMEKLRLAIISLAESPVMIELSESKALWGLDDEPPPTEERESMAYRMLAKALENETGGLSDTETDTDGLGATE